MCRWFDSGSGHFLTHKLEFGRVAQSVEHLTFNQVVRGSNPRTLIVNVGENVEESMFSLFFCLRTFLKACVLVIKLHLELLKSAMQDCG